MKDGAARWRNVVLAEARTKAQARELAADLALSRARSATVWSRRRGRIPDSPKAHPPVARRWS